ncbi:unnamed protein product [Urochloa decumbens]|uniref:FBD domain-containing protein n=1 Tax=Urochloa decumbens TaxID=240449 RepID=A0ABC9GVU8_9POAL
MGLLALNRLVSFQRQRQRQRRRRRGQIRPPPPNGLVCSVANGKRSNHEDDDSPQGGKRTRYSGPDLPEDVLGHIHSLMPLQDAARAASVSHAFLRSWRSRPNIAFSSSSLGLTENGRGENKIASDFNSRVDHILKRHSGFGLRTLEIEFCGYKANTHCYLNSWLEFAVTPELQELTLMLPLKKAKYCFPSSLFSNGRGNSIRHLNISWCAFSTTVGLDSLKNLTNVTLRDVRITEDELGCLLSNSSALEQLNLIYCSKITCVKIPCLLKRLSCFNVLECDKVRLIENKAPNVSCFHISGGQVQVSLAESLQVKHIVLRIDSAISYACVKLPSAVPNLENLSIFSSCEAVSTPLSPSKFLHLKFLCIHLLGAAFSPAYDCFSVVYFLDAAPSLETFVLGVSQVRMQHDSIVEYPSPLRQVEGRWHNHLKNVKITGFCSSKSLVELACYVLANATSLDCLTLDTTLGAPRCSVNKLGKCLTMEEDMVRESQRALLAVEAFIVARVPPAVKLVVLGPCSLCQDVEL